MSPGRLPHPVVGELALRRITRRQLARDVGISYPYLTNVLNAHERPSRRLMESIAERLDRPVELLFREVRS